MLELCLFSACLDLKNDKLKHLTVPQYESLTNHELVKYASQKPGMLDYMPE